MHDMLYRNRKFKLAVFALLASCVALFTDKIGGGEWIACVGAVLGLYGWSNVADKKEGGAG